MSDNSTAASNVIQFKFETKEVRTILIDDQPWFVAADVAQALEYRIAGDMTRNLDEDEKGTQIVRTPGGEQEMLVINESGLYSAILRSRKAESKRFKKWVTAEVLPAIRKRGRYEDSKGVMTPMVDELLGKPGALRLSNVMRCRVAKLDAEHQRSATAKLASAVHACFGVPRIELIPRSQFDAAANFVASYAIEGEYIPHQSELLPNVGPFDRYMVSADWQGKRQITPIPPDACVMSRAQLMKALITPGELGVSTEEMFDFVAGAIENLRVRSLHKARRESA